MPGNHICFSYWFLGVVDVLGATGWQINHKHPFLRKFLVKSNNHATKEKNISQVLLSRGPDILCDPKCSQFEGGLLLHRGFTRGTIDRIINRFGDLKIHRKLMHNSINGYRYCPVSCFSHTKEFSLNRRLNKASIV